MLCKCLLHYTTLYQGTNALLRALFPLILSLSSICLTSKCCGIQSGHGNHHFCGQINIHRDNCRGSAMRLSNQCLYTYINT